MPQTESTSALAVLISGAVLLALAAISFVLSTLHLGTLGLVIALGIAVVKGTIVVLVFMELAKERVSIRLSALAAILMMLLLVTLMTADVATRERPPLSPNLPQFTSTLPVPSWQRD